MEATVLLLSPPSAKKKKHPPPNKTKQTKTANKTKQEGKCSNEQDIDNNTFSFLIMNKSTNFRVFLSEVLSKLNVTVNKHD